MFGVVFALGAGSAAAQLTIKPPKTVAEGGTAMIAVEAKVSIPAGAAEATVEITTVAAVVQATDLTTAQTAADVTEGETDDSNSNPATLTLDIPTNAGTAAIKRTVTGTIVWQTRPDLDAEDEAFTLTFTVTPDGVIGQDAGSTVLAGPTAASAITIDDAQTQTFVMEVVPNQTPTEGGTVEVMLKAMPDPDNLTYDVALAVDETGYSVSPNAWQFAETADTGTGPSTTLIVSAPANDKNRMDDTVMLTALEAGTVDVLAEPVEIEVKDIHGLPDGKMITAMAFMDDEGKKSKEETMSVMEGGDPVHVTVTVDRGTKGYPSDEKLNVALMTANGAQALDYRLEMTKVVIDSGTGKKTADVKLWALKDDDVGPETLVFSLVATGATMTATSDGNGPGESMGMFSIDIADATEPMVSVKDGAMEAIYGARDMAAGDNEMINPGENFNVKTGDLFEAMEGYDLSFGASSDHEAVSVSASGDQIMVMPQEMNGTAVITLTATASAMASSFKTPQTVSNVAHIMFEVMVTQEPVTFSVMPLDDMNLTEGMSAMVTVMASRGVDMDTEVMLMRDGSSSAGMDDVMIEPMMATMMAGEMMAEFDVMAVDDMTNEGPGGAAGSEMLTLFVVVDGMQMQDASVMFYIWDMAVPALPIIAQLLLGLFLALGGYRRYLRR